MEARKGRGYVYALEYHIVWCTKYRRKVLSGPVEIRLKELLSTLAKENETAILEMEVMEDHVHLLIQASPQVFLPTLLKIFKGVSARLLFEEFGSVLKEKLWGGHLWNPSYFIATVSEQTESQIRTYIQEQKEA